MRRLSAIIGTALALAAGASAPAAAATEAFSDPGGGCIALPRCTSAINLKRVFVPGGYWQCLVLRGHYYGTWFFFPT